jgi:hypothetical protein
MQEMKYVYSQNMAMFQVNFKYKGWLVMLGRLLIGAVMICSVLITHLYFNCIN